MTYTTFEVKPIGGALGAEIYGANLADAGNEKMWIELQRALDEFLVVAIRGQKLSPADQYAVGQRFGKPCFYPFATGMDEFPEMTRIVKEPEERENFGNDWHSDTPYLAEPPAITMLYSVETPPRGGDTLYANMEMAYQELSPGMKKIAGELTGVFSAGLKYKPGGNRAAHHKRIINMPVTNSENADAFESKHPVVRTHPIKGTKALYCSALHTLRFDEMTERESRPLINMLNDHAITPEFTCRMRWEPGQLTIWDNRVTMHNAINDYHGSRREMRRLTVRPEKPV